KPVSDYSLGMIQRLGIAQAIMEDQQLIVLDEPTNALDRDGIAFLTKLLKELRNQGKLVLIASHDLLWLQTLVDQTFELTNGQL
ncbi:ATP-binding cassette domain-containing protein, partial [Lacticaseibacillus paracasei]|uniref:ATP-binding cassette domain-containing protein n=2 Tax=Lacticaseibacillus TaxID=2759736 RepID=UPI0005F1AE54